MNLGELVIDVDDVTAQFRRKFVDVANNVLNLNKTLEDCVHTFDCEKALSLSKTQNSKVWVEINKRGFARSLELMPGAGDAIEKLASRYDISFLTRSLRSSETWASDRYKWVRKHFGATLAESIITTRDKHKVDADAFIDDRPEMIDRWCTQRKLRCGSHIDHKPILFAWPYNREYAEATKTPRLHTWAEILNYLRCT